MIPRVETEQIFVFRPEQRLLLSPQLLLFMPRNSSLTPAVPLAFSVWLLPFALRIKFVRCGFTESWGVH